MAYTGPGPSSLIGGDISAGFFGETSTTDLTTGDNLASILGLSAGNSYNTDEPWLKFILDGKILYVAKKPFRTLIARSSLDAVNAIYGDNIITIGGSQFKIRLLKGANEDPTTLPDGQSIDPDLCSNSEWNRLIYRVHNSIPSTQTGDNWYNYTDSDLWVGSGTTYDASWCQESHATSNQYLTRGRGGLSYAYIGTDVVGTRTAWRPVLEYIPPEDTGPGPQSLIGGDYTAGFYGEIPAADLITGDELASEVGFSEGISQNSDAGWLKFTYQSKTLFVAKKPIRSSTRWSTLYNTGLVYGIDGVGLYPYVTGVNQYTTVTIDNNIYIVRLIKGGNTDPATSAGGEWDSLVSNIHNGTWASYTASDIGVANGDSNTSWCQETLSNNSNYAIHRGFNTEDGYYAQVKTNSYVGWRPVLELVGKVEEVLGSVDVTQNFEMVLIETDGSQVDTTQEFEMVLTDNDDSAYTNVSSVYEQQLVNVEPSDIGMTNITDLNEVVILQAEPFETTVSSIDYITLHQLEEPTSTNYISDVNELVAVYYPGSPVNVTDTSVQTTLLIDRPNPEWAYISDVNELIIGENVPYETNISDISLQSVHSVLPPFTPLVNVSTSHLHTIHSIQAPFPSDIVSNEVLQSMAVSQQDLGVYIDPDLIHAPMSVDDTHIRLASGKEYTQADKIHSPLHLNEVDQLYVSNRSYTDPAKIVSGHRVQDVQNKIIVQGDYPDKDIPQSAVVIDEIQSRFARKGEYPDKDMPQSAIDVYVIAQMLGLSVEYPDPYKPQGGLKTNQVENHYASETTYPDPDSIDSSQQLEQISLSVGIETTYENPEELHSDVNLHNITETIANNFNIKKVENTTQSVYVDPYAPASDIKMQELMGLIGQKTSSYVNSMMPRSIINTMDVQQRYATNEIYIDKDIPQSIAKLNFTHMYIVEHGDYIDPLKIENGFRSNMVVHIYATENLTYPDKDSILSPSRIYQTGFNIASKTIYLNPEDIKDLGHVNSAYQQIAIETEYETRMSDVKNTILYSVVASKADYPEPKSDYRRMPRISININ